MTDDPNEAYDVEPIPAGELMASHGGYVLKVNGVPWLYGPKERMEFLATDQAARVEARRSKKLHDIKPSGTK